MAKGKSQKTKAPMGVKNGLLLALSIVLIVSSVLLAGYTSVMNWTPLAEVEAAMDVVGLCALLAACRAARR